MSGLDDASREDLLALIGLQQRMIEELRAEVAVVKPPVDNLADLYGQLRAGAANVAGLTFQVTVSALLLAAGRAGDVPGLPVVAVRPEGFEDIDCELSDGSWLFVQSKERGLDARSIAAAELAEILARAAQVLRLTHRAQAAERQSQGDPLSTPATAQPDGGRTGLRDCRLAVVTNGSLGSSLSVTGWTETLGSVLAQLPASSTVARTLTDALRQRLGAIRLLPDLRACR